MTRMQFAGAAIQTTLTDTVAASGAVSLKIDDATGWPDASVGPFEIIVGAGLPNEEKMLVQARTGTTLTVAAEGRGYDGTTPQGHESGEVVYPIVSALWFDKVDQHVENPNVHLSAGAVQTSHLADSAVTEAKIASSAVTTAKIDDGAVTTAKLASSAVTTAKIDDGAVTTAKLDDGAITPAKLAASVIPIPIGAVIEYPVGPLADWMVELNGQAISRSAYPELHALYQAAGYPYGDGDGSTTFNVEDRRGRFPVMLHGNDGDFDTVGGTGGSKAQALTTANLPPHGHPFSGTTGNDSPDHVHTTELGGSTTFVVFRGSGGTIGPLPGGGEFEHGTARVDATSGASNRHTHTFSGTTGNTGSGTPFATLPPFSVTRWVVRAK